MRRYIILFFFVVNSFLSFSQYTPNYYFYDKNNKELSNKKIDIVMIGNSITYNWGEDDRKFLQKHNIINRGICGQSSSQILLRFRKDVIELKPNVVIINAGTNDLPGHIFPYDESITVGNIITMAELAKVHNIKVYLSSVLPCKNDNIHELHHKIKSLNKKIKEYAEHNDCIYIDYFSQLDNGKGQMDIKISEDGVHPNTHGYKIMENILSNVLKKYRK